MASYSTEDALSTLCTAVPAWCDRLDELNGQISLRQIELARLTLHRPSIRSLRNKGSTESLRPKDGEENPFLADNVDNCNGIHPNPFESPKSGQGGFSTTQQPLSPSAAARAAAVVTPPPAPKADSNPQPSPKLFLNRQSSQPTPSTKPRVSTAPALRKRKTDSLVSEESLLPKYRTRSMIIVYYDSAVQTAFEELVKFVSGSRNSMRKGKMAAKMADMRRAAELDIGGDDDDDDDDDDDEDGTGPQLGPLKVDGNPGFPTTTNNKSSPALIVAADSDCEDLDVPPPKLQFVSTRQMGPTRDRIAAEAYGSTLGIGILRGYRRSGSHWEPDIFEDIDKGLEWCQSQCEHAAHQFLREGDCSTEINKIKKKLVEVKETAQREVDRLKKEEVTLPYPRASRQGTPEEGKCRSLKSVQMRREVLTTKDLEVDMEVDDEGVDDVGPTKIVYKRSRDIRYGPMR